LFDLTDKEVWSKAIEDSLGLVQFYEKEKNNYMWGQRVNAQVYTAKGEKNMAKLKKLLKKKDSKGYTNESLLLIANKKDSTAVEFVNENIYSKEDYSIVDEANEQLRFFENKEQKLPLFYTKDDKLVFVSEIIPEQNKRLDEAKGQVTADYQDFLEKQWIEQLRAKYSVTINQKVWDGIKAKF